MESTSKRKLTIYDELIPKLSFPFIVSESKDSSKFKTFTCNGNIILLSRTISSDVIPNYDYFNKFQTFAIFSCVGGYFAGLIQSKGTVVTHKAFHRVVSSKTGTKLLDFLISGKYDENKHKKEILELLQKWNEELVKCDSIFLHAPGKNKSFFYCKGGLEKDDSRICSLGLNTSRPSHKEIMEAMNDIIIVYIYNNFNENKDQIY